MSLERCRARKAWLWIGTAPVGSQTQSCLCLVDPFCTWQYPNTDPMCWSTLPYLGMKLGKWPKFQKLHINSFYPRGSKLRLFLLYGQRFPRYRQVFKFVIFGHETWQVAKVSEVAHIPYFYHRGLKLTLFLLYGQHFPRYGPIFKIHIFGKKLGKWSKFQNLHTYLLFTPDGVEIEVLFALRAAVSEKWANFLNCHIWAWNLACGQNSRSCTSNLFLPQGFEIKLIFDLRAAVSEIWPNF